MQAKFLVLVWLISRQLLHENAAAPQTEAQPAQDRRQQGRWTAQAPQQYQQS